MTFNLKKYKLFYFLSILFLFSSVSCAEKELKPSSQLTNEDKTEFDCDGYELAFSVAMDGSTGTRSEFADYEDYVETKDHFRIFFFDKDGNFLVNTMDRTVTPLGVDNAGRKKFYVRVPFNYIIDRQGNAFDVDMLKTKLKEQNFKVAILANWPNPEGSNDENASFEEQNPRDPNWGWWNSILYKTQYDKLTDEEKSSATEPDVKTINDFHYLSNASTSKNTTWIEETRDGESNLISSKGIVPSANVFIPMYGVQEFNPIGDYWKAGSTFYLSDNFSTGSERKDQTGKYTGKDIFLLRSVAKIQVYFPYKVSDVRMYNVNSLANCEPIDVSTPTSEIWHYEDGQIDHEPKIYKPSGVSSQDCEWFLLGNHGYVYNSNNDSLEDWFKGCLNPTDNSKRYPHIYNENKSLVEWVEFTQEDDDAIDTEDEISGIAEVWYKYVLYIPEKYMDSLGASGEPIISYIEFKALEGNSKDKTLRFYLADEQPTAAQAKNPQTVIEYCHLWPILRNHNYTFFVAESEDEKAPTTLIIRARIRDWGYKKLENTW